MARESIPEPDQPGYPPVLIPEVAVRRRVRELGRGIARAHDARKQDDAQLVLLGVLNGAFMFTADLVRAIDRPAIVDFIRARSYGAARASSGTVTLELPPELDLAGKHVLVVEDVLDTGRTLGAIRDRLAASGAAVIEAVTLLRKPKATVGAEYIGFEIDDRFVVGYGLDEAGRWRHLPYVGYLDDDVR